MKGLINQIVALCIAWRAFSFEQHGHTTKIYTSVRCYFAEGDSHTAVKLGQFPDEIDIGFHPDIKIDAPVRLIDEQRLSEFLATYTEALEAEKAKYSERGEAEKQAEKQEAISRLEKQISLLKGDSEKSVPEKMREIWETSESENADHNMDFDKPHSIFNR